MAQAETIEDRTEKFISAYNMLKKKGLLPDNETLAAELGYKSDASISEILGRRQNIPPKKWALFLQKWPEAVSVGSDNSERSRHFTADQLFEMYMSTLEGQNKILATQTALLENIRKEMARETTQTDMKISLADVHSKVTTIWERQHLAIEEIREQFESVRKEGRALSKGVRKKAGHNDDND